jgi:signal peptidase II
MALALALILGGALGNLVDRLLYGHVIDFIDLYYGDWHWPTFNIADSAITLGAALLLLDAFAGHREKVPGSQ